MGLSGHAQSLLAKLSPTFKAEFAPGQVLGEGAMGVVISATQARLERKVAIKFLLCFSDPDALNRFGREAQLSSLLDHPRIVRLFTSGVDGELPYIVYEFVEGRTLKDVVDQGALPVTQALALATQLFEGLEHAHGQAIVHRDLKPANMLVDASGNLKIADYGIGSSLTVEWALTRTGTLMGTPAYMAPEQWSATTTIAADVYAAGVVLHEMLLGANPFVRKTLIGTRNAHVHEPRVKLGEKFDPRLDELLEELCAKDPAARPTAAAVVARLQEIKSTRVRRDSSGVRSRAPGSSALHRSGGAKSLPPTPTASSGGASTGTSGTRRVGPTVGIALVIFALGLLPVLKTAAKLEGPVVAVAGSRAAALTLECARPATPGAVVEPAVAALAVNAVDRGGRTKWTVTLAGLEPGVAYRVQPTLDGKPAGPVVPVTTLGGPEQLAAVVALTYVDPSTLSVRFRTPVPNAAALAISSALPSEWVPGAAGEVREVRAGGLDVARDYEPVIQFDGLPETVPLGVVPGASKLLERARKALATPVGGPSFADRLGILKKIAARAQKRAVETEKVREVCERYVREATGFPVALVQSAARACALDEKSPVVERWKAREVLDGLLVVESIGHPWCKTWVFDVAGQPYSAPKWEWVGRVPRPPEAPALTAWVAPGPICDRIAKSTLPLWTHRERNLDNLFMLNNEVADSYAIEPALSKTPHWAWLTPPAPPDRNAGVELVLKTYNLVEDHILWLKLGEHKLAVPGLRGSKPTGIVSIASRKANGRGLRVAIPMEVWRDTQGVEVRVDGFQATESAPVADEIWIADGWLMTAGP